MSNKEAHLHSVLLLHSCSLEEIDAIKYEAEKLLKKAGAKEIFPTPIDKLIEAASLEEITDIEEAKDFFLRSANKKLRDVFTSGWSKIRGFADIKKKAIFVKPEEVKSREVWPRLHEIGHQILSWQAKATSHLDDNQTLSPECEEIFEQEANACAAELLFQGDVFQRMSNSYKPEFNTIFSLAKTFGASIHSTARIFVNESEEPIAILAFYPSKYTFDENERPYFQLARAHSASKRFVEKYPELKIPKQIAPNHPWLQSYPSGIQISDSMLINVGQKSAKKFLWESWWNGYTLLVLIRRQPPFKIF